MTRNRKTERGRGVERESAKWQLGKGSERDRRGEGKGHTDRTTKKGGIKRSRRG